MKTALITGGSRGIGRESAITLARQDHAVVINYAGSAEDADNTVREIESFGGKAISVRADVASSEQVQNLFKAATKAFGGVDILVASAGVIVPSITAEATEEDFDRDRKRVVQGK